jgi:hypothetical protein
VRKHKSGGGSQSSKRTKRGQMISQRDIVFSIGLNLSPQIHFYLEPENTTLKMKLVRHDDTKLG